MFRNQRIQRLVAMLVILSWCCGGDAVFARPSVGHVGGGGGRPSVSRPSPNISRPSPNISRPSPNISRPSLPSVSRPSTPDFNPRPSLPSSGFHPSGGRPNISLPSTPSSPAKPSLPRPSTPDFGGRPAINLPGDLKPVTRPSLPGSGPGSGAIARPTPLPSLPNRGGRPTFGDINRPTTRPSFPIIDGGNRPGNIDRPGSIDRPIIGGGRPDFGNRPGSGGRPGQIDRPIIGDGNIVNRPGGNVNIGNNVNIGINRPGWGLGSRPAYGDHWYDRCVNHHYHGWYHGCWNGHWASSWYVPMVYGATFWGISAVSGWGYGPVYSNPYYDTSTTIYNYSQPVVVATNANAESSPANPQNDQAMRQFDQGLELFKSGNYVGALSNFDAALKQMPNDPVLHEVRALSLFALGRYKESAAALNSLLATAPGMDWTTMANLYGDTNVYTQQLRALEAYVKANKSDAAAAFVLAYHYLVIGQQEAAIQALQFVVKLQPGDTTAARMLAALTPPAPAENPAAPAPVNPLPPVPTGPQTDLVGNWRAKNGDSTIDLAIDEQWQFVWKVASPGKPPVEVKGQMQATDDTLALESADQGTMAGKVASGGPDKFTFQMSGMPPTDPGLVFERIK